MGWSGIPIPIRAPSMSLGKIDSRAFCRLMKRTTATPTHVKMVESVWKVFVFAKRGERVVYPPLGLLTTSPTALSERTRTGPSWRHVAVPGLETWSCHEQLTGMADSARDDLVKIFPARKDSGVIP